MFADIDATGWSVIIGAVFLGLIQLATLFVNYFREKAKIKREQELADRVEAVKAQAEVAAKLLKTNTAANVNKLDAIAVTGEKTHALVNSAMAAQLRVTAVALRRIADVSGNAADMEAAELAEKNLADHQEKQKRSDALYPKTPNTSS